MIVDLFPTEEQTLVQGSIAALLADRLPVERLRATSSHAAAAEMTLWPQLTEIGLFGLGLAEERGGVGYTLAEEVLAAQLLGRHLASPAILAQMIAVHLAKDDDLRQRLIAGQERAAFLNPLDADIAHLIDGAGAGHGVIVGSGLSLVRVDTLGPALPVDGIDETVSMFRLAGCRPAAGRDGRADRLSLLLAAYLSGIAASVRDMAVSYAKTREQFGQPIGAFQAIKHMCADMALRAAAADAQCRYAAVTAGSVLGTTQEIASARLLAGDAALANARANIQIHGGMGFTAECDAHLYLKRAHLVCALGSSRRAEQTRILG